MKSRRLMLRQRAACWMVGTAFFLSLDAMAQTDNTTLLKNKSANSIKKTYIIPYPFLLNDNIVGELPTQVDGQGNIALRPTDVADALKAVLSSDALTQLKSLAPNDSFLKISQFPPQIVKIDFDMAQQQLVGQLNAASTGVKTLAIAPDGYSRRLPASEYAKPAKVSAYMNVFPYLQYQHKGTGERGLKPLTMNYDGATRLFGDSGFALEGAGTYQEDGKNKFTRGDVRAVYDRPNSLVRAQLGDIRYNTAGFQGAPRLGGISIAREFNLRPNEIFRPTGQRSIQVDRASDAEIYVNGTKVRTLRLDAGRYDLSDFPYTVGNNNVEILLRDRTGRVERVAFSGYQDFDLLKKGLHDYSYNVGFQSRPSGSGYKYMTSKPVASAYHRYALSDDFTANVNAQAAKKVSNVGVGAVVGTSVGLLGGDITTSRSSRYGNGTALSARYRFDRNNAAAGGNTKPFQNFSLQTEMSVYSPRFTTIEDGLSSIKSSYTASVGTNLNSDLLLYASAQYDRVRGGTAGVFSGTGANNGTRRGASVGMSWTINDRLSSNIQTRYLHDTSVTSGSSQKDWTTFASLNWRLNDRDTVNTSYNSNQRQLNVDYYHSADNTVDSFAYNAGVSYTGSDPRGYGARLGADYIANRYQANVTSDTSLVSSRSGNDTWLTSARLGTALAFADGHVALSRPIYDSFAMVVPDKTIKNVPIGLNPSENGTVQAKSDWFGPAVISDIYAYYPTRVTVKADNLPIGYDIGKGAYDLMPSYRSGYGLQFGSAYSVTVVGTLDASVASMLALTAAKIESTTDPAFKSVTTFTNAAGRFASGGLKAGTYRLRFLSSPVYVGTFTVPDDGKNLVRINNITLTQQ